VGSAELVVRSERVLDLFVHCPVVVDDDDSRTDYYHHYASRDDDDHHDDHECRCTHADVERSRSDLFEGAAL
jgi:hypothetical protein